MLPRELQPSFYIIREGASRTNAPHREFGSPAGTGNCRGRHVVQFKGIRQARHNRSIARVGESAEGKVLNLGSRHWMWRFQQNLYLSTEGLQFFSMCVGESAPVFLPPAGCAVVIILGLSGIA